MVAASTERVATNAEVLKATHGRSCSHAELRQEVL